MFVAVENYDEKMVRFLIDLNASIDETDFQVHKEKQRIFQRENLRYFQGQTALILCARQAFVEGLEILLEFETNSTNRTEQMFSCLTDGTFRQEKSFLSIARRTSADFQIENKNGKPLLVAICELPERAERIFSLCIDRIRNVDSTERVRFETKAKRETANFSSPFETQRKRVERRCTPLVPPARWKSSDNYSNAALIQTFKIPKEKRRHITP